MGINTDNIKVLELEHKILYSEVEGFDAILVGGGNCYYLLDKARKSGFKKVLDRFLKNGVYVGISAGSILVAPEIRIAKLRDINIVNLKELTAFNYVDFAIAPHMGTPKFVERGLTKKNVRAFAKTVSYEIIPLTDQQAVLVEGKKWRIVG